MILRHRLPRLAPIGDTLTLDAEVYADADTSAMLAASAGTVTVTVAGVTLLDAAAVTVGGAKTATRSLDGALTAALSPSGDWLETWRLTIAGVASTFQRAGYLVRTPYRPAVTDDDLLMLHPDLADPRKGVLPTGATFAPYRQRASEHIQRRLISKGRRPWLIFDAWAHHDAEVALTLSYVFRDAAASVGDERYSQLAEHYTAVFDRAIDAVPYRYDPSETGIVPDGEQAPAWRPTVVTAGPIRNGYRRSRW